MRKAIIIVVIVLAAAVGLTLLIRSGQAGSEVSDGPQNGSSGAGGTSRGSMGSGGGFGGPGFGGPGGGFGGGPRLPMTVELAPVTRADLSERILVVGNLIGAQTVDVVSKTAGRLQAVDVRIGDRVTRGQRLAKVEDREIQEQVRQAEASYGVSQATIRQREADLRFAETNLERSRSLYERQLISKQTLDDADARYQAAVAQLDLARAQFEQSKARLEELRINLANTVIVSPVDGFVGKRNLDPGAWTSTNTPVVAVVDLRLVRLVANLVEKDLRRVSAGMPAEVDVDAFPGEVFAGRVARVAPVLDPSTRTAQMEVEVTNDSFRLKPGMYARVRITVDERKQALAIPRNALVVVGGKQGVFMTDGSTATFHEVSVGLEDKGLVEVTSGLNEGDRVITTGAAGLRDGDRIQLAGQPSRPGQRGERGGAPGRGGQGRPGTRGSGAASGAERAPGAGRGPGQ